ncbi:hypothetical protein pdam_00010443 [Pocillopora damicornis]|uniref:Uncharacterized protein n=1 Tax=Pocillopora damicornis TaxID=46731 RepID=A0A3M6U9U7_POCDA|nr:hypothetical protein pdam_00010443 [Pocillopora damicornis]
MVWSTGDKRQLVFGKQGKFCNLKLYLTATTKVSNEEISKWNDAPDVKVDANVHVENLEESVDKKKNRSRNP